MMISLKKLISMALKWKKMAGIGGGRRTISLPRIRHHHAGGQRLANKKKGYFVVYSADKKRFVVPLEYLQTGVFRELLRMSEEEFGLPRDGPIVLPCDAAFLEDVILCIVQRPVCINDDKASLLHVMSTDLVTTKCSVAAYNSSEELVMITSSSSSATIQQILMHPFD